MPTFRVLALLMLQALAAAAAEPKYPPLERAFDTLPFKRVAQRALPEGMQFWTSECAESNEAPDFEGNAAWIDLNGDGRDEIIVESKCKLDNQYEFFQRRNGRWISLLTVWGRPDLLRKRNGFFQVTVWPKRRDGTSTRELYTFLGERYHVTRLDEYRGDEYVRPRNTKEREEVLDSHFKGQFTPR